MRKSNTFRALAAVAGLLLAAAVMANPLVFTTISRVTAAIDVPVQLTTSNITVRTVTFVAFKAPRTINTGTVYIQVENLTNTVAYPLAPGQTLTISGQQREGRYAPIDLSTFWIESPTAGDGVQAIYIR